METVVRSETWIPSLRAIKINDGPWLSEAGLPLPIGGAEWVAAVRAAEKDLRIFEDYPDGYVFGAQDHGKVTRYCAAERLFRMHHVEITRGLLVALAQPSPPSQSNTPQAD